jgi:phage portal protein BeeE
MQLKRWIVDRLSRGVEMPVAQAPGKQPFLISLGVANLDINPVKTKGEQLDSYVGWVYACVGKIAQDTRTNPRGLWKKTGRRRADWTPVDVTPDLFKKPNLRQTWGQLIETRNQHKDLTGESWWHMITVQPGGKIMGLEMIQPDWVDEPIFNPTKTAVEAWWVNMGGSVANRKRIEAIDMVLDFYPSPRDPLRGASPVEAFALSHHLDIYMRAYGVKLVRDGAMVTQSITTDQDLTPDEADVLESRMTKKYRSPGRMAVFGKGAKINSAALPFKDLDMLHMLRPTRDQIFAIYGVPAAVFGLTEGAGDTNQKVAKAAYQENCILPRLLTFDEIMNEIVIPRCGLAKDVVYESESPVEVDREFILKKESEKFRRGASTINEFFQGIGDDKVLDGDYRLIPKNVIVIRSFEDVVDDGEPADPPPVAPPPAPPEEDATSRITRAFEQAIREADKIEITRLRKIAAEARFLNVEDDQERTLKSKSRQIFSKEQKEVREALERNVRTLVGQFETRDWLDVALKGTKDDWEEVLRDAWEKGIQTGAGLLQEEVAGALSFKVFEERARRHAMKIAGEKVVGIQGTTLDELRRVISKGIENGDGLDKISRDVASLYDGFKGVRSQTIARTEVSNSIGWGKYEAAKESEKRLGMNIKRTWIATFDERTRSAHADADGQQRGMSESYLVGGVEMKHPGDSAAPPELVINCRCTETYRDVSD